MPASTPTPTPQGISAMLRKAGFLAAGRYRNDEGYRATWADGSLTSVCVKFCTAGDETATADGETSRELLALAALALTACDCTVERRSDRLIVTAKDGDNR